MAAAVTAASMVLVPVAQAGATGPGATSSGARPVCAAPDRPGFARCLSLMRTTVGQLSQAAVPAAGGPTGVGYGPNSLRNAYGLSAGPGPGGQIVAIVDAYDDPHAAADLAVYRSDWGLPACSPSTGAGCLSKINQNGAASPLPAASGATGWATEESLDVDMVSAICPYCKILLVEANSENVTDLGTGVNTAIALGAKYVSNSYGTPESTADPGLNSSFYNHPGVAITAAAGDNGYGTLFSAASRFVTAVGGTTLSPENNARGWSETVWDDLSIGLGSTGSGCSAIETKPTWQTDTGCSRRTDNDVAADADPNTGVAVYDTYDQAGWLEMGGTSAGAPMIAAVYALAGTPTAGTYPSSYPYQNTGSLWDVTSGGNGTCTPAYLCTGEVGYDGPTGWGTPHGLAAFAP
jgi:subtilase family serine protease